jgi:hypothetical protein
VEQDRNDDILGISFLQNGLRGERSYHRKKWNSKDVHDICFFKKTRCRLLFVAYFLKRNDNNSTNKNLRYHNTINKDSFYYLYFQYRETFGEELRSRDKFSEVHYDFLKEINDKVTKSLGAEIPREQLVQLTVSHLFFKFDSFSSLSRYHFDHDNFP